MSKSVYITSLEAQGGKTSVALAFMEQLSGRVERPCLFRPIVADNVSSDRLIALITSLYDLPFSLDEMYGISASEGGALLDAGQYEELYSRVLSRYKALESRSDFIICVGTNYSSPSVTLEFGFNVEIARNLGSLLVPIINGHNKEAAILARAAEALFDTLEDKKCDVLAIMINRVDPGQKDILLANLSDPSPRGRVYVLPQKPLLEKPTVREIADALGAEVLNGEDEWLNGVVGKFKIGAMELPDFLDNLEEDSLVIAPADRSDIILGALAAERSTSYPRVAGLALTGDRKPAPQVLRLLQGLHASPVPIISVQADTFSVAARINDVRPSLSASNTRKIAVVLGLFESAVDIPALIDQAAVTRSNRVTPLMFQHELIRKAKVQRKRIVLPEGTEERILRAAEIVLLRDVCDIILLGNEEEVRRKGSALGLSLERLAIIDPQTSDLSSLFADAYYDLRKKKGISREMARDTMTDVNYFGTMMVYLGKADGMISGSVHATAHTIRPALEFVKTKPEISIVSSVFFMCLADRVLVYGDCAIVPNPTADQLADIAISSAETTNSFGMEARIAMLSYSTGGSGHGRDVERVQEATRLVRERRPDLKVEGPIQYDAAVDDTVAKLKLPGSEVAGHATVFIFPDLSAGNNAYKAVQRATNAVAIGPVLQGLKKPVNDLSRGALVPDIVNTIAITAIQAQTRE